MLKVKTKICTKCGETDIRVLSIDYIDGGGKKQREKLNIKAGVQFYRKQIKENFSLGYQVLCLNHNCGKGL